jgi:ABC-2 type transport system permease protein
VSRYAATARMATAGYLADGLYVGFDYALRLLRVLVLLALWRIVLGPNGANGMSTAAVLTYTLVAAVFAEQLAVRTDVDVAIWNGLVASHYLRPHGIVAGFAAETAGRWLIDLFLFSLPLFVLAPLLGVNPLPASVPACLLFAASLALGISIGLALEFFFAALIFALDFNLWAIRQLRGAVEVILSGAIVPLALMPWGLGDVLAWTPYASTASAALRIYTGTGDPTTLLLGQLGWNAVLWPLVGWLWSANRERLVSYGG